MNTFNVKVVDAIVGKYDTDSIIVFIDNVKTEICFNKNDNVTKLIGSEIELYLKNGSYNLKETKQTVNVSSKKK